VSLHAMSLRADPRCTPRADPGALRTGHLLDLAGSAACRFDTASRKDTAKRRVIARLTPPSLLAYRGPKIAAEAGP